MKSRRVINETHADYEKLIYHTVSRFIARFGGDFEEYCEEANIAYCTAYNAWRPEKGYRFSTFLVTCIRNRLKKLRDVKARERSRPMLSLDYRADPRSESLAALIPDRLPRYNIEDLEDDARTVVNLILSTPADLADAISECGSRKNDWRLFLSGYLEGLGWSRDRVADTFGQLTEAFS